MNLLPISPAGEVVIPRVIAERLRLRPGQLLQTLAYRDRVILLPLRSAKSLRGFLRGIETRVDRDPERA
jgi:bifunctional DNA-binding transcriptional regulator/antitoxin component of YhaV-PrlF toxin-antitoxin module